MSIDLTVDNYSIDDLMVLFGQVNVNSSIEEVQESADALIKKFTNSGKPEIADFFRDASLIVIEHINAYTADNPTPPDDILTTLWKQTPFEGDSRVIQPDKTFEKPIERAANIQITSVLIASQFRTNILPFSVNPQSNSFNTNFSFSLSKSITKAISIQLYQISIPTTWYTFTLLLGNTFFTYNGHLIIIPDGNYTITSIVTTINSLTLQYGLQLVLNPINNRLRFENTLSYLISPLITFFIKKNMTNVDECGVRSSGDDAVYRTFGVNSTLGWMLGFRNTPNELTGDVSEYVEFSTPLVAQSSPNVHGSVFFCLSLEEYSNQRLTKGLSNIVSSRQRLTTNLSDFYSTTKAVCRLRQTPLTHAQQLTLSAVSGGDIITNDSSLTTYKIPGYQADSAFALIPIDFAKIAQVEKGYPYTLYANDLNAFKRNYKTPTIIEKIKVSLTDDKGNLVNLNDSDWMFTVIVEERI